MALAASPPALAVAYVTSAAVGVTGPIGALSLVFAAAVDAAVVPVAGALTDRFGQVRTYRGFALFQLVAAFPIRWALSQGSTVLAIVVNLGGPGRRHLGHVRCAYRLDDRAVWRPTPVPRRLGGQGVPRGAVRRHRLAGWSGFLAAAVPI